MLQPPRRQPQISDRVGDPVPGEALVARLARHGPFGQDTPRAITGRIPHLPVIAGGRLRPVLLRNGQRRTLEGDKGNVVFEFRIGTREPGELAQQVVDQAPVVHGIVRHEPPQPGEAEHLAAGVVGLHQTVAVEEDAIAGSQGDCPLVVAHVRHQTEGHAGGTQLGDATVVAAVGQVVPGVGVRQPAVDRIQDGVQASDEHVRGHVRAEQVVGLLEDLPGPNEPQRGGPQHAPSCRHHQRRRHAL